MAEKKSGAGRPSKYGTIDLAKVKQLAVRGWTDEEMSNFFNVTRSTWSKWKVDYPEFSDTLSDWKLEADNQIVRSLFERAKGYSHPEDKIFKSAGEDPTIVPTIKHYPPDTTACIFWLKNRDKQNWRDRPEGEGNLEDVAETIRAMREAILNSAVPEEKTG